MKKIILLILLGSLFNGCAKNKLTDPVDIKLYNTLERLSKTGSPDYYILPEADDWAAIPHDKINNPLNAEKVALGKLLFYETALAGNATHESSLYSYSCATCHIPEKGFMPGRKQGIADGAWGLGDVREINTHYATTEIDVQSARPLSLLNVAYISNTTWTGKFGADADNAETEHVWDLFEDTHVNHLGMSGIESQLIEGQNLHRMKIDEYILDDLGYRAYYDAAFPELETEERYGSKATAFALAAYIRTLLPNEAPFQMWLKGDENAMTESEKRGAILFYGKAGCYRCHKGSGLNSNEFHAIGVKDLWEADTYNTSPDDLRNLGRAGFTLNDDDLYKFRVPSIYNMKDSPYYFHGSSKNTLWGVVEYFNNAIGENENVPQDRLSPYFHPLNMSVIEIQQLVDFLSDGLRDPNLQRYVPETVLSGNCFPNNDPMSRQQQGCD